jgi:hypothetical protein
VVDDCSERRSPRYRAAEADPSRYCGRSDGTVTSVRSTNSNILLQTVRIRNTTLSYIVAGIARSLNGDSVLNCK